MQVMRRNCKFLILAFICLNFSRSNINVSAGLVAQEGISAFTGALSAADKLDLTALGEVDDSPPAEVETAATTNEESSAIRQKRQIFFPYGYGSYGRYYGGYPYYYPYSYGYYYRPLYSYSYGWPYYTYG